MLNDSCEHRVFDGRFEELRNGQQPQPINTVQAFTREFTRGVSVITRDLDLNGTIDHIFSTRADNGNGGRIVIRGSEGQFFTELFEDGDSFERGMELG